MALYVHIYSRKKQKEEWEIFFEKKDLMDVYIFICGTNDHHESMNSSSAFFVFITKVACIDRVKPLF